jgi:8-oxo-dGTP pyrophosphatase MutT (NUDIX family)
VTTSFLYTAVMAHIHEKIDFTASVFIVHEQKVLLHMHKKLGKWLQPGGHIELDEDPNQAAIREAKEETGLDVVLIGAPQIPELHGNSHDIIPPKFLNRHPYNNEHEHVDLTYFATVVGGELRPEDGVEMRWFTKEELEQRVIVLEDTTRAYALAALHEFGHL